MGSGKAMGRLLRIRTSLHLPFASQQIDEISKDEQRGRVREGRKGG